MPKEVKKVNNVKAKPYTKVSSDEIDSDKRMVSWPGHSYEVTWTKVGVLIVYFLNGMDISKILPEEADLICKQKLKNLKKGQQNVYNAVQALYCPENAVHSICQAYLKTEKTQTEKPQKQTKFLDEYLKDARLLETPKIKEIPYSTHIHPGILKKISGIPFICHETSAIVWNGIITLLPLERKEIIVPFNILSDPHTGIYMNYQTKVCDIRYILDNNTLVLINPSSSIICLSMPIGKSLTINDNVKFVYNTLNGNDYQIYGYSIENFGQSTYPRRNNTERFVIATARLYRGVEITSKRWYHRFEPSLHREYHLHPEKKEELKTDNKMFFILFTKVNYNLFIQAFEQLKIIFEAHSSDHLRIHNQIVYSLSSSASDMDQSNLWAISNWPKNDFADTKHYRAISGADYYDYKQEIIIKPNGFSVTGWECITKWLSKITFPIRFEFSHGIMNSFDDALLDHLYPNSQNKEYGIDWIKYLKEGPSAILTITANACNPVNQTNLTNVIRESMLCARKESDFLWTRNIVHCAADEDERVKNLDWIDAFGLGALD